jgi:hypothetical protein
MLNQDQRKAVIYLPAQPGWKVVHYDIEMAIIEYEEDVIAWAIVPQFSPRGVRLEDEFFPVTYDGCAIINDNRKTIAVRHPDGMIDWACQFGPASEESFVAFLATNEGKEMHQDLVRTACAANARR